MGDLRWIEMEMLSIAIKVTMVRLLDSMQNTAHKK